MCGIAGEVSYKYDLGKKIEIYNHISDLLKDRGPDQGGMLLKENVALIHRRLAVIDVENGRQPMSAVYNDNTYTICYNGEIYNTAEVRNELIENGFSFETHSDTEVILKAFICFGEECVNKLNGIFAFAVWNEKARTLFLARDRIGVKPLFYGITDGGIVFASELKAMIAHPSFPPRINTQSIAEIMLIGPGRTMGYGVFENVFELPPATCGIFNEYGFRAHKYWVLEPREHREAFWETAEHTRFLVKDAIERQLVSDVPVATFLSGGLDSSLISSIANNRFKADGKTLTTFSVDYKDNDKNFKKSKFQPNSDTEFIDIMADYLKGDNRKVILDTSELVDALYDAVNARDLPGMADVDSSMLLFCREIKKVSTVALSGECADEIFGGYPWYRDKTIRETDGFPWAQSTSYRYSFMTEDYKRLIDVDEYVHSRYENTVKATKKLKNLNSTDARMMEMMRLNLDWFMQTLLDRKDRMSMYSGLEVRVPFCDYRIAQYLYNVPWEYKDYGNYEKGLLRCSMEGLLPKEVLWRKKSPYPKTHNPNYLAAVSAELCEVLQDNSSKLFAFVKKEALEELLKTNSQIPWYGQLMTTPQTIAYFLQINYWLKHYNIEIV